MNARTTLLAVAAAALVAMATACGDSSSGPGGDATVPPGTPGSNHVLGSPEAPVKIVEYADFQ